MMDLFLLFLNTSLASAAIILLLLVVRRLGQKLLVPGLLYSLWFVVLIKLLVPFMPESPVSLFNLIPQAAQNVWHSSPKSTAELPAVYTISDSSISPLASLSQTGDSAKDSTSVKTGGQANEDKLFTPIQSGTAASAITEQEENSRYPNWAALSLLIWIGGLLIYVAYHLLITFSFRRKIRTSPLIESDEVLAVLEESKKILGIRRKIPVYETSQLRSPSLYGLMKPAIYLPKDIVIIADSEQLKHILLHELVHYKHKDLWINSLWSLAVGLHWFNPLVWLARAKMSTDRELSCDAAVLKVLGERESSAYGMTLLMLSRLLSQSRTHRVNLSSFIKSKNETKRRIMMITKFKSGSYKISIAAILLMLALGAVLLPNASGESSAPQAADPKENTITSFKIYKLNGNFFKWFNSLDRAQDFAKFDFKIPDYLPEDYQLESVNLGELFSKANQADLINTAAISFVYHFGKREEMHMEMIASKGKGTMLEHNLLWGAPTQGRYRQESATISGKDGTLYTKLYTRTQHTNQNLPGKATSFVWQDGELSYAINYYADDHNPANIQQKELAQVVQSMTTPDQVQHVDYKGDGNSFPLYDEKDLADAKSILGFPVKFPFEMPGKELKLADSILLRAGDQNTNFPFRESDTLWNTYRTTELSDNYDLNDQLELYQSKAPLVDPDKLTYLGGSDMSYLEEKNLKGVEVTAFEDKDHIYHGPVSSDQDSSKYKRQIYYTWKQNGIYYLAAFFGMDQLQDANLEALVLASTQ